MNRLLLWITTAILGAAATLMTSFALVAALLFLLLAVPLVLRAEHVVALSGLLTGFGAFWSFLMARQFASARRPTTLTSRSPSASCRSSLDAPSSWWSRLGRSAPDDRRALIRPARRVVGARTLTASSRTDASADPHDEREARPAVGARDLPAPGRWNVNPDEHRDPEAPLGIRPRPARDEATGPVELSPAEPDLRLGHLVDVEVGAPPERLLPDKAVGRSRKANPDLTATVEHRPESRGPVPLLVGLCGSRGGRVTGRLNERRRRLGQVTRSRTSGRAVKSAIGLTAASRRLAAADPNSACGQPARPRPRRRTSG